ncbi:MAG TPA: PD-(D/E)XK nuclease family protein, partial [Albitalea sp.]
APAAAPADDDAAARLGQAVHRVLEWACAAGGGDPASLAAAAAAEFGLAARADAVAMIAARVLASPAITRFFDRTAVRWAGNEVPVAGVDGEVLRIDRLVQLGDEWWVLDYKLRHAPQELAPYRAQLAAYRAAVQRLQPGGRVRAAFVTGSGELVEAE